MSSQPAEKRMKPSGTSSVPQRARRSAVECTPPKLVASLTSSQASRNACACSADGQRERRSAGADARATGRCVHVVAAGERLGERAGVRLRALQPQPERGQRAVREPGLERPEHRAGARAPGAQLIGERGVAHADRAEQHVRWPLSALVPRQHREVGAVVERPQAERRGDRVVDRQQRAARRAQRPTTASRSTTSSFGFEGVSTQTSVAPSAAATIASVSVGTAAPRRRAASGRAAASLRMPGIAVAATPRARRPAGAAAANRRHRRHARGEDDASRRRRARRAPRSRCVQVGFSSRP